MSVAELTAAVAAGDPVAFGALYEARFNSVYAIARRATGRDESFCLDVTQDAFMRVIKSMKPMETEEQLGAWLRRVTITAAYDRLRRERAWHRRHRELLPLTGPPVSAAESVGDDEDASTRGLVGGHRSPRRAAACGGTGDSDVSGTPDEPSPSGAMSDDERLEWLRHELAQMDESALFLLEARHRFGWTLERIGRALGMKPGAVDGRLGRVTAALEQKATEAGHRADPR